MADVQPLIEISGVHKYFGRHHVLKDINLTIYPGEVIALVGPSGAGKSTLLRTLNQLESIDAGSIHVERELLGYKFDGRRLVHLDPKAITKQRQRFGMVFQQFNLFPHMTVLQNVAHAPIQVRKVDPKQARVKAQELLVMVGLGDRGASYPAELSGGQQQRVAIARALAMEPEALLFDEPTSSLDPELVEEVLQVIRRLSAQGHTMVIATHEMRFAQDVADRIVFMIDGAVEFSGPTTEFFSATSGGRVSTFLVRTGSDDQVN